MSRKYYNKNIIIVGISSIYEKYENSIFYV